jgi:hypothetical protein
MSLTLEDLKKRQRDWDDEIETFYSDIRRQHPDIEQMIPIVLDPIRGLILKKGSKPTPVEVPMEVVNAIRLRSIKHTPFSEKHTCVKCVVKYDDYGYVVGVEHYWYADEDTEISLPDGSKMVVEGLRTKIQKGKVRIKDKDTVEILP